MSKQGKAFLLGVARVFGFAFVGAFLPLVSAYGTDITKELLVAAATAGLAAGAKALLDALTKGVAPVPTAGIFPRKIAP